VVIRERSGVFATDAAGELDVLGHDGHSLGVDRAQVGVLEDANQVRLGGLLQDGEGTHIEAHVGLEVLRDLADQALEGQYADQQLRRLLVLADLAERHGARAVAVGLAFLGAALKGGLARRVEGELLAGRLATSGLASGLFSTSHPSQDCCVREREMVGARFPTTGELMGGGWRSRGLSVGVRFN
jgi:hypothetical protein